MGDFNSRELTMIADALREQIQARRERGISDRGDAGQPWWDLYRKVDRLAYEVGKVEAAAEK